MRTQRHMVQGGLVILSDDLDTAQVDEVLREEGVLLIWSESVQGILDISAKVDEAYPEGHDARMRIGLRHLPTTFEYFVDRTMEAMKKEPEWFAPAVKCRPLLELKDSGDA